MIAEILIAAHGNILIALGGLVGSALCLIVGALIGHYGVLTKIPVVKNLVGKHRPE